MEQFLEQGGSRIKMITDSIPNDGSNTYFDQDEKEEPANQQAQRTSKETRGNTTP